MLDECHLGDLGFKGPKFIWTNCTSDGGFIKEWLDREVTNIAWCGLHKSVEVHVLEACSSDHKPLLMWLGGDEGKPAKFRKYFMVEASWMIDKDYNRVVSDTWVEGGLGGSKMQQAYEKLENCQSNLSSWSSSKFWNATHCLK